MPDLTAALPAQGFGFAGGEGREVVVVQVALGLDRAEVVEFLRLTQRAKRGEGKDLSLTAGEQAGAMCARRGTHLAPDRADLGGCASIRTLAQAQDALTDDRLFSLVKGLSDRGRQRVIRGDAAFGNRAELSDDLRP